MKRVLLAWIVVLLCTLAMCIFVIGLHNNARAATTLLPNGEQCFQKSTGPVASGSINMYQPGTTTPKTTWQNSTQTTANTQPIQLDANGCAIIYGVGSYRQQLYDGPVVGGLTTGNLIFDLTTTDTSAYNSTFWAGTAGGTANVITITDTGFNATDGSVINFTPIASNTGATTINPSAFGAISVLKDTTNGPVALVGGEIVCTGGLCNVVSVVYRAADNAFHILNPVIQSASGSTAPLCGATGWTAKNNAGTPNTEIDFTATVETTINATGAALTRSNVSNTINFSINGANGLDTGAIAASTVYYIWLIDNGSAAAGLVSLSSTAPTMPAGYTYKCRLGAMDTDGSSHLYTFWQAGATTQITASLAANSAFMTQAVLGTCFTNFVATTFTGLPPTAVYADGYVNGQNANHVGVGRGAGAAGDLVTFSGVANLNLIMQFQVNLTTAQVINVCNDNAANTVLVNGWVDAVNAQ